MSIPPVILENTVHSDLDTNKGGFRLETLDYIPMVSIASGTARFA